MKAYLAWPVQMHGKNLHDHHITLKYLGSAGDLLDMGPDQFMNLLTNRLTGLDLALSPLNAMTWTSASFRGGAKVMVLKNATTPDTIEANKRLEQIREDDFPVWQPHVTVSARDQAEIKASKTTPFDNIARVGMLYLYIDKKPYAFWNQFHGAFEAL